MKISTDDFCRIAGRPLLSWPSRTNRGHRGLLLVSGLMPVLPGGAELKVDGRCRRTQMMRFLCP
ncbi:hypothetical protein PsYK624_063300 [Phanerochaete sordida]|uniref:Uncharacterized protein n=1 Tax=Phanerochaete sordida TaxID=48140 RepID=A0A9P3LD40_9APHY|nr:hypothetical protein PsYK624_063300 [Phanerochaete sordida]